MPLIYDRVYFESGTTGTGTFNVGTAETGYQDPNGAGAATGDVVSYVATQGSDWEVGEGTLTSGSPWTLSRDTIIDSTNAGSAVNFGTVPKIFLSPGTKYQDWRYISATRPTSDVATITETGLSIYSEIEIQMCLQFTSTSADIDIYGKQTAGTARLLGRINTCSSDRGGNYTVCWALLRIENWAAQHVADFRIMTGGSAMGQASIDNTSNTKEALATEGDKSCAAGYASYAETFDEIILDPSAGNIEGSSATQRGLFILKAR